MAKCEEIAKESNHDILTLDKEDSVYAHNDANVPREVANVSKCFVVKRNRSSTPIANF